MKQNIIFAVALLMQVVSHADDFATRCADRAALEHVYHEHRTGPKPPFEQAMPPPLIEQLVRTDLHKEIVLRKAYAMEISPALLAAEVQRINTTTRAPEMLAEIKQALGGNAERFAGTMARPILVERELHRRFDNDDRLHAEKRHEAEQARARLLAGKTVEGMHEVTWQLTPRPAINDTQTASTTATAPTQGTAKSASYTVETTTQVSQVVTTTASASRIEGKEQLYFEDLDPQLQNVLRVQLKKSGDVSAVIELPADFMIFQAKERNATALRAASLFIPKRSYEEWLAQQPD